MVYHFNVLLPVEPNVRIDSFFAPYFCEFCQKESAELVFVSEIEQSQPPCRLCDTCNSELQFDAVPDAYLGFVTGE
jgi:hypothetical protein